MTPRSHPGWVRRLWGQLMLHRTDVSIALVAGVLGSGCQAIVPLLERTIVDSVIVSRSRPLWPWLSLLLLLAAAGFGFAYLRRYRGGRVALAVQNDLRNAMQSHLQRLDLTHLDALPTGQLVARANADSALVQGLLSFLPLMAGNLLLMALSLIVMVVLSPLLAVVGLLVAPTLFFVSYRLRNRVFPASWDAQQREGELVQIVDEDVSGVRVVKAFGQERRELERVIAAAQTLYGAQLRVVRLQARYQPLLQVIPTLGQVAVLAFGGWLVLHHRLTLGTFLAFSTYIGQLLAPARQLAGVLTIGQQARAGAERIFQLLDLRPNIADAPDAVDLPRLAGDLRFDGVHVSYGPDKPVLRGFALHLTPGERVAVVAPSGAGKSTVAMLVSRFYDPDSGAVLVDGHDVRSVTLASLRSQVGVVFDETFLFSDTIRANIAYAEPDATDEQVRAAAAVAQADGFIADLPAGYDTVVGERGLTLSGGQRQRIALARAVLSDPRILVLDDATSAVDARTEQAINAALRSVMRGRTTLLVAHRRSTLHLADRVVVMDDGCIVDEGSHEELLARSQLYRTLLTGLDEQVAAQIGDRVEALAAGKVTSSAWTPAPAGCRVLPAAPRGGPSSTAAGPRGVGGGAGPRGAGRGAAGWRLNLAPTPELMAKVAALPPVRDALEVDVDAQLARLGPFRLVDLVREFRWPLLAGLTLVVLDALASLAGPVLVRTGIDSGVARGSTRVLMATTAAFLLVALTAMVVQVAQAFVTGRTAQTVMLSLRVRIWAQLQRLSLDYYEREMTGRILTRMTTDVDQFETLIDSGLLTALVSFVTFIGVGVALLVLNVPLALCTLAVAVPLVFATVAFRRRSAALYDVARDRIAAVNADFQESLSGVREAQAFAHEPLTIERFRAMGAHYLRARVAAQRLVATYFPFVLFLSACADAVVLGVGDRLVHSGQLTAGVLLAFILYVDLFFSPIQQLSQVFDSWQQTRVSVGRISELMGFVPRTAAATHPIVPGRLRGGMRFADVHFAYPDAPARQVGVRGPADAAIPWSGGVPRRPQEALRGIDLEVAPGETIALVGETGAGKSTLVKLIARFYDPDAGAVHVDGLDLRQLDIAAYRRQLGYVPQEAFLFTGSIRDNIAYGRPDAPDADVEAAARAVAAHPFIAQLPGGYLHAVSERGRSLSSSQRQLIALARAELVDPAVLLLDEATSNLDLGSEARVAKAMQRVAHGRTTILIAHRLQTARAADRIVVLEAGRVVEVGQHEELVARGGRYARMWQAFEELSASSPPLPSPA